MILKVVAQEAARHYTYAMTAKKPTKKTTSKASTKKVQRVDIYPNRMSLAIAALAAVSLVLFGLIALS